MPRNVDRRRRRRWRGPALRWWLLAGAFAAIVFGLAAYRVVDIGRDLRAAKADIEAAAAALKAGQPAAARAALRRGELRINHANSVVNGSPELGLVNLVPVARQNLSAMKESVAVALRLTGGGRRLLDTAQPLEARNGQFEVPLRNGAVPLDVLERVTPQLDDLGATLPLFRDRPTSRFLLPPVRVLIDTVYRQSDLRRRQLSVIGDGINLLKAFSGNRGTQRMLIAIANAAEMRGTGGMYLSYGELLGTNGQFTLERFGNIDEIALDAPATADLPQDYLNRFGALGPTLHWRNANLGLDFASLAPVMLAMYRQGAGKDIAGVVQIDSMGLAAMMRGTGPVEVPGLGTVTADNVVEMTLSRAYARFTDRTQRQEVLGDVAEAVFRKLVTGNYPSLRPLATALVEAAAERRIMLHMGASGPQRSVQALGIDGNLPSLGRDFAALTVQNFSANKLDYYIDSGLDLRGERLPSRVGRVRAEITVTNTARPGEVVPRYVFGPNLPSQQAGLYNGMAALYLPKGAGFVTQSGDLGAGPATAAVEMDRAVFSVPIRLGAGESKRIVIEITLPPASGPGYRFDLIPASRVRPTTVVVDLDHGDGHVTHRGAVTRPLALTPGGA